jgi:hypothetical protein
MATDADLFFSLDTKDLDRVDVIELVEEDLRRTPSPESVSAISYRCRKFLPDGMFSNQKSQSG